ncbi:beta-ketoacyl synthase N-terminal-like domain-containing protein [Streptomyces cyaneofuscatus]|uniref:beta-ketoacyl synthase N-terminal-like domain-containing protein n=1 Tax=Streptomyces cyaneofuscatus TaxID=66883 RepID=UPI00369AA9AD
MSAGAVITGIGVLAPSGTGVKEFWDTTLIGRNMIGPVTRFDASAHPARLAGEIHGFDPAEHLPVRLVRQTDRMTQLALAAADQALADSGVCLDTVPAHQRGVVTAVASGGSEFAQNELRKMGGAGGGHVSAYASFAWFPAVNSGQISVRNDLRGPAGALAGDHAAGLDALGQAGRRIRGGARLIVAGGVDAPVCSWAWAAHLSTGLLSTGRDPERAYLPFDAAARGHVLGEGGALMIVEDETAARARGAHTLYGRIAGHASTLDPRPGSGREPGLRRAAALALAEAGCRPADIDVVFADAAGTPRADREEAEAITRLFGPRGVPVTAPKAAIGRLSSGGAPVDVVTALLAIRDGRIPATPQVEPALTHGLDLVTGRPRTASVRTVLVLARGHGGFNAALVLRAVD